MMGTAGEVVYQIASLIHLAYKRESLCSPAAARELKDGFMSAFGPDSPVWDTNLTSRLDDAEGVTAAVPVKKKGV